MQPKNLIGKKVLIRVDLNVPLKDGQVTDDFRLQAVLPTIQILRQQGARVILLSHLGRPKGMDSALSLKPVANTLSQLLPGVNVHFVNDCVGPQALEAVQRMQNGDVLVLENLRFHEGEEKNQDDFAKSLASLGDLYMNDAFGCSHRAHASVDAITRHIPAEIGPLFAREMDQISTHFHQAQRPLTAILGGSKISSKLGLLKSLATKVDFLIVSGGIANTLLKAKGYKMGTSLVEDSMLEEALQLLNILGDKLILPIDEVVATSPKDLHTSAVVPVDQIPQDKMVLDVGPKTLQVIQQVLESSKTVIWNGSLGVNEYPPFDQGTNHLVDLLSNLTTSGALVSLVGGGDTIAAIRNRGFGATMTYLSTGGGAFLEFLEGLQLPALEALKRT